MNRERALAKILDYIEKNPHSTARDIARGIDPKGYCFTPERVGRCIYPAVCKGMVERTFSPNSNIYCYSIRGDC